MTDNRTTELLPCPFCGGEAEAVHEISGFWTVECVECGALVDGIAAWNTRTHGTLTAEQVRKVIFDGSVYASYDGVQYYANGISMQAIADELNAELGSGTCHDISVDSSTQFYCSECECTIEIPLLWGEINYCPNCGKVVRDD